MISEISFGVRQSILSTFCLCLVLAPASVNADERFVGILALAAEDDVAEQLELSDETKTSLKTLIDDRLTEADELLFLPKDQQAQAVAKFVADSEVEGLKLLTPEQQAKLQQIRISRAGMITLTEPQIAEKLALSDDQKAEITELVAQRTEQLAKGGEKDREAVRQRFERQFVDLLEKEQLVAWNELAGQDAGAPADPPINEFAWPDLIDSRKYRTPLIMVPPSLLSDTDCTPTPISPSW
ncbi:MAG: hypothetical protein IH991_22125, partial [Planctomycetes bacterium]|nr:hypothetical protein [Planctomycetota bacterium]